ncbi:glutathione S-transferase [Colletotrichum tofieldiae]|uniref:Glutathione S-transferase n=1 Tax=Colletotrichum tofieldiae TaxID=708197 RepID=A0A161VNR4_9PEZI|nr:glutathione S-transferase [Colletotrichum tofieldiae]GKT95767.1 glutathione S-transferase [Colletotrichum tofieldiae]
MKPIILYSHQYGPNPWKVALMLEELRIPYKTTFVDFTSVKKEPFTLLNPNGRLPAIEDPNTGMKLWESGAIVEYLVDQYDSTEHKISPASSTDRYFSKQWLFFQVSGQAPYYGQASWFLKFHPEKVQSVIDRYVKEMRRINAVLESVLRTRDWLVGDSCTYADLSFVAWQRWAPRYGGEDLYENYPHVGAWMKRMEARPAVQKTMANQDTAIAEVEAALEK